MIEALPSQDWECATHAEACSVSIAGGRLRPLAHSDWAPGLDSRPMAHRLSRGVCLSTGLHFPLDSPTFGQDHGRSRVSSRRMSAPGCPPFCLSEEHDGR